MSVSDRYHFGCWSEYTSAPVPMMRNGTRIHQRRRHAARSTSSGMYTFPGIISSPSTHERRLKFHAGPHPVPLERGGNARRQEPGIGQIVLVVEVLAVPLPAAPQRVLHADFGRER